MLPMLSLQQLNENGLSIHFQWVPSHVGVLRNEKDVDKLAREATSCTRFLKVAPDE